MDPCVRVGVLPAAQHRARSRLFAALEEAYPVRFHGREAGAVSELDAIVAFGDVDTSSPGMPSLTLHGEERAGGSPSSRATGGTPRLLALASDPVLARPLRGARLTDEYATALHTTALHTTALHTTALHTTALHTTALHTTALHTTAPHTIGPHEQVLAEIDGAPAWVLDARGSAMRQRVACAPAELGPHEALRERLRPGRSLALLALAHFLAQLTAHLRPPQPALRAAFIIDDPNLRRPRYGHLDYASLLGHARLHGYHLAVAMVPLDARLAHPRAIRLFREGAAHLSLCIHGNDHDGPELGRPRSDDEALALVAQALRRTAAFERRTGIAVDRVMAPPHERLCEPVARALRASGFQALTTTRPYPWVAETIERPWLDRPRDVGPLAAWRPVDRVAGGLPVLLRADFRLHPREDLVLRAFLGQPLILYGHHDLLAGGPDALAEATAQIDRLGEVRWSSLAAIARAQAGMQPPRPSPSVRPSLSARRAPSPRLPALLRRLASEGRDRAAAIAAR